jgi:NitT/TauT family transport system permease protein
VYFTIVIIGLLGFASDFTLRLLQRRVLYWLPKVQGGLSSG